MDELRFKGQSASQGLDGELERRMRRSSRRTKFGISFLDDAMVGLNTTDLVLVGGRSGAGKSQLSLGMASRAAEGGKRVLYYALESDKGETWERLLYQELARRVYASPRRPQARPSYKLWRAGLQEDLVAPFYADAVEALKSRLGTLRVRESDRGFGPDELASDLAANRPHTDLVVIDHLHYLRFDEDENRSLKKAMQLIRDLVVEDEVPVVLVAHIRKADRFRRQVVPDQEDFHGSSDIPKISTKAITIATGEGWTSSDNPLIRHTIMRVCKFRDDGSVMPYVGVLRFNVSRAWYEPGYELARVGLDKQGETLLPPGEMPDWAINGTAFVPDSMDPTEGPPAPLVQARPRNFAPTMNRYERED